MNISQLKDRFVGSPGRILVTLICLLAVLDLGRSIYARIGYAKPAEAWQAAPYQGMAWPPGVNLAADTPMGERVYVERCAVCHGTKGQGDGPAAPSFVPRPRDFTTGDFKYKSTPAQKSASDDDLYRTVADGLTGSAMPHWRDILSDKEIKAVVGYVKSLSLFADEAQLATSISVASRISPDADSLARGKILFTKSCVECHDKDGRGAGWSKDRKGEYPTPIRDLTAPWTFRGGQKPEDLWKRLTTGMRPGPMPEYATALTASQRWDIVNYTLSLSRTAPWVTGGKLDGPGHRTDPVKRGEYLVHAEMCGLCHTQVNRDMIYSGDKYYLAGGMAIPAYPQGTYISRNLTPDPETGLGNWSVEEIAEAIRNGRAPERGLNLWGMPWMYFHSFEQDDALAIASYLKSRPAVKNRIPAPLRYGLVETVVAKIAFSKDLPPMGSPRTLTYMDGNFGETNPGLLPRDWPQQVLVWAQWIILAVGLVILVTARPLSQSIPRGFHGWVRSSLSIVGVTIATALVWVMYSTPVLNFVPPAEIGRSVASTIPTPDPDSFASPEQAALAKRGQYLYTVTSCAFCHNNDGSGGAKVSMQTFGSLWVGNITSDKATGIGNWSDHEIARAIRSGVSKGGGVLHWQGMTWDHLSNLDEEDVRAIIVYLRTLPPVQKIIPAATPPSVNDCTEYTFFLYDTDKPGC